MNLSFYIARRYLVAKKTHNAVNVVSFISVVGVAVGSMALIVVLSVFNGFDGLIKKLFGTFNPELMITIKEGKTFRADSLILKLVKDTDGVMYVAETLEENALLRYGDRQYIARIKGVSDNYQKVTGVDTMIAEGKFILKQENRSMAVIGMGVSYYLAIGLNFQNPIVIYVPRRGASNPMLDPTSAFRNNYIFPSGIFSIQNDFDSKYVILPIDYARNLLEYENEVTALELKLKSGSNTETIKKSLKQKLGDSFHVKDRYEQNAFFYRIMKSEKWAIYFILTFILIVASFNMIGSLTLLIIEKKQDIKILQDLGANERLIRFIFLTEGWLISAIGAITGIAIGLFICWLQQTFGLIELKGSGSFIIKAYPVEIRLLDTLLVFAIVLIIGFITAYIPSRYITERYIKNERYN